MSAELHKLIEPVTKDPGSFRRSAGRPRPVQTRHDKRTNDRRIQIVLMLLEENPQDKLVILDIAQFVNLSPSRLAHLFKSEMGISLQQYLIQLRLANAKHQLESGFLSVKEIAAAVGFCNVNQFTNSFKTTYGITPTQYRNHPRSILPQRKDLAIAR